MIGRSGFSATVVVFSSNILVLRVASSFREEGTGDHPTNSSWKVLGKFLDSLFSVLREIDFAAFHAGSAPTSKISVHLLYLAVCVF